MVARDAILAARRAGKPGFLLGDLTGLGKTLSVWSAVAAMPEVEVLVVAPKGALPQWRRTIARAGLPAKRVTLTNYERSKSLLALPARSARKSVRAKNNELARAGVPKRVWPIVVFDESHRLRNPYAQQSLSCRQVADAAVFVVYLSATAGQSPHELSYLGRLLGEAAGQPCGTLAEFRELMKRLGMGRAKGRWTNWRWEPNVRDRTRMADLLYRGPHAIGLRRRPGDIAGWPEVQRELSPTALAPAERRLYDATWRDFRREFGLLGGSARRPAGWAADLRFRQKASLLRVAGTADFAEDQLDGGAQVAVSVAYLETGTRLAGRHHRRAGERRVERGGPPGLPDRRARRNGVHGHGIDLAPRQRDAGRRAPPRPRGPRHAPQRHPAPAGRGPLPSRRREGGDLLRLCRGHRGRAHRHDRSGADGQHGRHGGGRYGGHRGDRGADLRGGLGGGVRRASRAYADPRGGSGACRVNRPSP